MCRVHSSSRFNTDLWPQGQKDKVYDMVLFLGHSCFVLLHSHTMWMYHHGTMCRLNPWTLYDLDLWSQYQNYICTRKFDTGKVVFALWHRHFGVWYITAKQHVVYMLGLCLSLTFDLHVCGGGMGVSLVSFTHIFNLVYNL